MLNYYFSLHCIKILHKCSFSQLPLLHPSSASYPSPILSLLYPLELLILIWSCRSFILLQLPILPRSCHSYIPLSFLSLSDLAAPLPFCSFLSFLDLVTSKSTSASYPCHILPLLHPSAASCPSPVLPLLHPPAYRLTSCRFLSSLDLPLPIMLLL